MLACPMTTLGTARGTDSASLNGEDSDHGIEYSTVRVAAVYG